MQEKFYPELAQEDRIKMLKAQCFSKNEQTYFRTLTEEEVRAVQNDFMKNQHEINTIREKAKEQMAIFKDQIEELEVENKQLMNCYNTKTAEVVEELYSIDDQETGYMRVYNANGDLIEARRLKPDEIDNSVKLARVS